MKRAVMLPADPPTEAVEERTCPSLTKRGRHREAASRSSAVVDARVKRADSMPTRTLGSHRQG